MTVLPLGSSFAGYEIIEVIGEGSMGVVYRARDPRLDREVALKVVADHIAKDPAFRERFVQEARTAARIEHPSVITIHAAGEENGIPFIAMRLVRGSDLATILEQRGPLSPADAISLLRPIAEGLDAAHAVGIVHRDVKPANILVPDDGAPAVLVDFGIGRVSQSTRATQTGSWVGTVDYVSPEQIRGADVDGRSDQYALACVLYEAIEGQPPFRRADTIQALFAHASEAPPPLTRLREDQRYAVEAALTRGLSKDPDERFITSSDLIGAAGGSTAPTSAVGPTGTVVTSKVGRTGTIIGEPSKASMPNSTTEPRAETQKRRRRAVIAACGVSAMLIAIALVFFVVQGKNTNSSAQSGNATSAADLGVNATTTTTAATSASGITPSCDQAVLAVKRGMHSARTHKAGEPSGSTRLLLTFGQLDKATKALDVCATVSGSSTPNGLEQAKRAVAMVTWGLNKFGYATDEDIDKFCFDGVPKSFGETFSCAYRFNVLSQQGVNVVKKYTAEAFALMTPTFLHGST